MNYEIVNLEEKQVVGLVKETTNNNNKAIKDIGILWEEFFVKGYYKNIENKRNNKPIGLYTDYKGDFTKPYNFLCCYEVNEAYDIKYPLVRKTISGGKYAKFIIKGDVQKSVGEFWMKLWKMNLDRKYSCDFEEYQNNDEDIQNQEIHIYISIN
ncbi:GyrI-like domain-containing protein [Paraclostridium sordellii]